MNQFDLGVSQDRGRSQVGKDLVDLLTVGIVAVVDCSSFSDTLTSCLSACVTARE